MNDIVLIPRCDSADTEYVPIPLTPFSIVYVQVNFGSTPFNFFILSAYIDSSLEFSNDKTTVSINNVFLI